MDRLDLRELLLGDLVRLRYVQSFQTCHNVHRETVAERSFYIACFCMFIADWLPNTVISISKLLRCALIQDMEKARTGYVTRVQTGDIGQAEKLEVGRVFVAIRPDSDAYVKRYMVNWYNAKDETIEGRILTFADYLSALAYVSLEVMGSNRTMGQHIESMQEYHETFNDSAYDFIRPLVEQAGEILAEVVEHGT